MHVYGKPTANLRQTYGMFTARLLLTQLLVVLIVLMSNAGGSEEALLHTGTNLPISCYLSDLSVRLTGLADIHQKWNWLDWHTSIRHETDWIDRHPSDMTDWIGRHPSDMRLTGLADIHQTWDWLDWFTMVYQWFTNGFASVYDGLQWFTMVYQTNSKPTTS